MNYEFTAKSIIFQIGGRKNIKSLTHCITRLRFVVNDHSKVNLKGLEEIEGVITVIDSGGQIQVVIGSEVDELFDVVVKRAKLDEDSYSSEVGHEVSKKPLDAFIDLVSGIFQPIIRILAGAGIIKGLFVILLYYGFVTKASGFYIILNSAADSILYYLPVIVGVSAAKKFKLNPYLGLVIGAALVHPQILGLMNGDPLYQIFTGTIFESNVYTTFLGLPVIMMNYSSSVMPAIFAIFFASRVDRAIRKVLNKNIKELFAPVITLACTVPATLLLIGPLATYLSSILSGGLNAVYTFFPPLAGLLLGGTWQVLVMFGLHWGIIPLFINEIVTTGSTGIASLSSVGTTVTAGVVFAIYLKTKNKELKALSMAGFISSICGVTEPALYGITLPRKKPFYITLIASAIAGLISASFGARIYIPGASGVFKIPTAINPEIGPDMGFYGYILALVVGFILAFVLTWIFGFSDATDPILNKNKKKKEEVVNDNSNLLSPLKGEIIALNQVEDKAFANGAMGSGLAIIPSDGKVYAPFDGELSVLFPTNHAIGLTSEDGLEVLVHIGVDTVKLNGQGFKNYFNQGDKVKKGDLLVEFDLDVIASNGYSSVTPVIITGDKLNREITITKDGEGDYLETLIQFDK